MSRHSTEQALVLTSRPIGEDNRIVILLGPERGIFEAMLYGGRKSKLRSLVSPWHSGTIWLYHDNVRNSTKISDFDPKAFRPSLRENIYKNMAASLATELVIRTQAAGENQACWTLFCGLLDGMELSDESNCRTGILRFLWRYYRMLGILAEPNHCVSCGEQLVERWKSNWTEQAINPSPEQPESSGRTGIFHYSLLEGGFLCPHCQHHEGTVPTHEFSLGQEAVRYLQLTLKDAGVARKTMLSADTYYQLRHFLFHLANDAVSGQLKTFETGLGIL